ncbi:type IV secretory system conjugative DNA transfer family protein [Pararhizobium sp. IMCC21322]|uniref:type IV secretory system conjugative DNA transfer family protein n=1 Tax=Pararhizobium sp. IMCC21322 TaxID=3067903 RepID=UPI002740DE90|nr:type IV secretory system conjugative DNA transfer family protein [Pararhizobium sp. IMCC21322]
MRKRLKNILRHLKKPFGLTRKDVRKIAAEHREIRRVIGLTLEDETPIYEPNTTLSWLVYGGAGSGKTTCVTISAILSLLADSTRGQIINDVKPEVAHQIAEMCLKAGRNFAVIDDSGSMGKAYPHRVRVNPFSNLIAAHRENSPNLMLEIESVSKVFINEPDNEPRNFYFRQSPRELVIVAILILLAHSPDNATPGGIASLIADPDLWHSALEIEAEEGTPLTKNRARQILQMHADNPEHYSQHILAALSAFSIFMEGGPLHEVGQNEDITHEQLLKENYIVCVCQNARNAANLSIYYGLTFNAFLNAQMSGECGRTILIFDEVANTPAKDIIKNVTIFRSFGLQVLYLAQSKADLERQNGVKIVATLEDNCAIQYLQITNQAAETISKAIGDVENVSYSINESSGKPDVSRTINLGKERLFTADQLQSLPADQQIIFIPGQPTLHCKKVRQNNFFPLSADLSGNPNEGGKILPPDYKVVLPNYDGWQA